MDQHIRSRIKINQMQFGFMPGKSTIDAIFIARQIQEKYSNIYFVDLEKAFDRVSRKVDLVSACIYNNAKSSV